MNILCLDFFFLMTTNKINTFLKTLHTFSVIDSKGPISLSLHLSVFKDHNDLFWLTNSGQKIYLAVHGPSVGHLSKQPTTLLHLNRNSMYAEENREEAVIAGCCCFSSEDHQMPLNCCHLLSRGQKGKLNVRNY